MYAVSSVFIGGSEKSLKSERVKLRRQNFELVVEV